MIQRGFYREIHSNLKEVDSLCREIRSFLSIHILSSDVFTIELTARECLNNSVLHGNKGQINRKIRYNLRVGNRWIRMQIADEGSGYVWRTRDSKIPDFAATHGRGLAISTQLADRINFNRKGNMITLWFDKNTTAKRYQHG